MHRQLNSNRYLKIITEKIMQLHQFCFYITICSTRKYLFLSYHIISCQNQLCSILYSFLPYTLLFSNTYKTYSKAAVRYFSLNKKIEIEYNEKGIYYLRILNHKTFFRIMVIETLAWA